MKEETLALLMTESSGLMKKVMTLAYYQTPSSTKTWSMSCWHQNILWKMKRPIWSLPVVVWARTGQMKSILEIKVYLIAKVNLHLQQNATHNHLNKNYLNN